jgi:hypothetical protein
MILELQCEIDMLKGLLKLEKEKNAELIRINSNQFDRIKILREALDEAQTELEMDEHELTDSDAPEGDEGND